MREYSKTRCDPMPQENVVFCLNLREGCGTNRQACVRIEQDVPP
jgi:hypothetical protein